MHQLNLLNLLTPFVLSLLDSCWGFSSHYMAILIGPEASKCPFIHEDFNSPQKTPVQAHSPSAWIETWVSTYPSKEVTLEAGSRVR